VTLLPMMTLFNQEGEKAWHLWVPGLAQSTLMARVLKGEPIGGWDLAIPALGSAVLAALCLAYLARQFAKAAVR
jgi:sodium transport system permease protein